MELKWSKDGFKYLGVYLGDDMTVKKNFEGVEEKIVGCLNNGSFYFPICLTEDVF